jgi:voltage-gated potassium channel
MVKKHYKMSLEWVEKRRFSLLLLATFLVLVLPAFSGKGLLSRILFVMSMSFLFIQSMIVATQTQKRNMGLRYAVLSLMIMLFWLEPFGLDTPYLDIIRLVLLVVFFINVTAYLVKFMRKADSVDINVIITSVNIYLLMGIIAGSLAFLLYKTLPGAYNIPANILEPDFVTFSYYSFITMSTVGYGDITPALPESQTLGYLAAITGQLYVAIIIAFLVGKLLVHADRK